MLRLCPNFKTISAFFIRDNFRFFFAKKPSLFKLSYFLVLFSSVFSVDLLLRYNNVRRNQGFQSVNPHQLLVEEANLIQVSICLSSLVCESVNFGFPVNLHLLVDFQPAVNLLFCATPLYTDFYFGLEKQNQQEAFDFNLLHSVLTVRPTHFYRK